MSLRLSEAIRLGAMVTEQGFGNLALRGETRCALGAALLAINVRGTYMHVWSRWPWTYVDNMACPVCDKVRQEWATSVVVHLNDTHRWTRECIADWVATVEPRDEPHEIPLDRSVTNDTIADVTDHDAKEAHR